MDKLDTIARLGRAFFGISLVAFGVQQVLWGDFVAGRARAFPEMWSGRVAWAWSPGPCSSCVVRRSSPAAGCAQRGLRWRR